ncbi:hypothetical protein ACFLZ7_00100 [Nanoarchaeota archaeon]
MNENQEMDIFRSQKPNATLLREEYPDQAHLLQGNFVNETPYDYPLPDGKHLVSWELEQGRDINPRYGRVPRKCEAKFNTGKNKETMNILEGNLEAVIIGEPTQKAGPGEKLEIPSQTDVTFVNKGAPAMYVCDFAKDVI